jgi:hypothetical protein
MPASTVSTLHYMGRRLRSSDAMLATIARFCLRCPSGWNTHTMRSCACNHHNLLAIRCSCSRYATDGGFSGDIAIMRNLSAYKGPRVEKLIRAAGAELRYLPPPLATPPSFAWCGPSPAPPSKPARTSSCPPNVQTSKHAVMIQIDRRPLTMGNIRNSGDRHVASPSFATLMFSPRSRLKGFFTSA